MVQLAWLPKPNKPPDPGHYRTLLSTPMERKYTDDGRAADSTQLEDARMQNCYLIWLERTEALERDMSQAA